MQVRKPVKLYFFVTFLLILAVLIMGLKAREYFSKKFPEPPPWQNETMPEKRTNELDYSFAIVDLAVGISLVMILVFVTLKLIIGKLRKP